MRHPSLLFLLLLPAGLAAQQPAANDPRSLAGCYALDRGPWNPAHPGAAARLLPSHFVLDSLPAEGAGLLGAYRVLPSPDAPAGAADPTWWPHPSRRDSLRVRWAAGGAAVEARLQVRGDSLRGTVVAGVPGDTAVATLAAWRSGDCPRPPVAAEPAGLEPPAAPVVGPAAVAPPAADTVVVERAPAGPPPPGFAEQTAGYTVGALLLYVVLRFAGIL